MKKIFTIAAIIILFVAVKSGLAQQEPMYNLYQQHNFLINPAATGDKDNMQLFIDARKQWSGIEGAPRAGTFGIHNAYSDKVGLGVLVTNDRAAGIERLSGNLNYSYKLHFSKEKKHNLVFGLGIGFLENKIDVAELRAQNYNDPILVSDHDGFAFDARFGVLYNFRGFELGASMPQILDNDIDYRRSGLDDYSFQLKRHYIFHTGYRISFWKNKHNEEMKKEKQKEERFFIKPSVMYKTASSSPEQIDVNLIAGTGQNHWIGATYRPTNGSAIVMAGIQVNNLNIAYAYQLNNTELTDYSNGTHEIMLSYNIVNKAREDRKIKQRMDELNDRHQLLKSELDRMNANKAGEVSTDDDSDKDELREMEERLQLQIDSLRNMLKNIEAVPAGDGSGDTKIIYKEEDNEELNNLQKQLDELRKNVLEIKGEKVYELRKISGDGENASFDKKAVEDGCYVIVYSFRVFENAERGVKIANEKGYTANILYNETRKWYYIYTAKYDELQPALIDMRKVREGEYDDAWVHIYKKE